MRILIDVQTLYTQEKHRGIGIYTYYWLKNIIQHDDYNRFFLMRRKENSWQFTFITKHLEYDSRLEHDQFWEEADLEDFIEKNHIDIVHFTSPLMFDIEVPDLGHMKVQKSYLVYDLIPIVMKDQYFENWPNHIQKLYLARCELIKKADLILTISSASKMDLENELNIDASLIKVVYASTNEEMYIETRVGNEAALLSNELGITKPFIYSLTGYDPRKNNKGLIQAFAEVTVSDPEVLLVISGIKNENEKEEFILFANEQGIKSDRIMFLGFVSNDALLSLYKECRIFVFPSLYEGFGLPVLEAMRVGTPVITTNCSSIVEVAEEAAILVDPLDHKELAMAMGTLLYDEKLINSYREQGLLQSKKFSWIKTTLDSLDAFNQLCKDYPIESIQSGKPTLAFFSPLNPQASGISDYSEELLVYLQEFFDIKIFINGNQPTNDYIISNFEILDINFQRNRLEAIKNRLYHVGNNEIHDWIYDTLKLYPGVVLLHDLNLYGLYVYTTFLRGLKQQFVNELKYSNGVKGLEAGRQLLDNGTHPDSQQFPMFNKVIDLSTSVIVHSEWIKESLTLNLSYKGKIEVIPQGCILEDDINSSSKIELKNKLNMHKSRLALGVFGHVIPNKRVDKIIKSFAILLKTNPDIDLYIVGHADIKIKQELMKLAKQLNADKSIIFIDSPDIEVFKQYIKACDVCINLRWPTMGETSATLTRALGYGVPCIVSNVGSYKEYPDDIVWKVDVDQVEEELLVAYLLELCNNKPLCLEMGKIAEKYMKKKHSFSIVSEKIYLSIIN
ncbi:MAG: glycosyltransferase [Candidatus Pristimantibacillus sp.]